MRFAVLALAGALACYGQAFQYRWIKDLRGSGVHKLAGLATDAAGNTYIAASTDSADLPVVNAIQPRPAASGLLQMGRDGKTWAWNYGLGANLVNTLSPDPSAPDTLYAATANRVFRTTDGGLTWTPIANAPQVNGIAVDPTNSPVLYAASSDAGVLKSVDGGATWAAINNGIDPYSPTDPRFFATRIWIDPRDSKRIFVETSRGLFRSVNAGASWTGAAIQIWSLAFDPFAPGTIYTANLGGGLSKSVDAGATFTALPQPSSLSYFEEIAADPRRRGFLYAGGYGGLYRSVDGGAHWEARATVPVMGILPDLSTGSVYVATGLSASGESDERKILVSTDGFDTYTATGPSADYRRILAISAGKIFAAAGPGYDVYVAKLNPDGEIVWSTYFGGASDDTAKAIALDADGNVFVTGSSSSTDFPVAGGVYRTSASTAHGGAFLFSLNSAGSLRFSTYFANPQTAPSALAIDSGGRPVVAGGSSGFLPVTPGAYQPAPVIFSIGRFSPPAVNAFITKFSSDGANLLASTYTGTHGDTATSIAIGDDGDYYIATTTFYFGSSLYRVSADATQLVASTRPGTNLRIDALEFDRGTLWIAGQTTSVGDVYTTPGAFQASSPTFTQLPGDLGYAPNNGFIMQLDTAFNAINASTLLGGVGSDGIAQIAFDDAGRPIVAGSTDSTDFPLRAPTQELFAARSGFLSMLSRDLTALRSSTYIGDSRTFDVTGLASAPDSTVVLAGTVADAIIVARVGLADAPALRIDAVLNAASRSAIPLAAGSPIEIRGAGFGDDAELLIDGSKVEITSRGPDRLTALAPAALATGSVRFSVMSGGRESAPVLVPAAAVAPALFTSGGAGTGQGYFLNEDGSRNSPENPASEGSMVTIFATGVGGKLPRAPSVFIDGFYASCVDARLAAVNGLPGLVYQIKVYVPKPSEWVDRNPNLAGFKMPPQVAVRLEIDGFRSQNGVALSVK